VRITVSTTNLERLSKRLAINGHFYSQIVIRISPERSMKLNRNIITDYFEKLRKVVVEYDFIGKSKCIDSEDHKGYTLIIYHLKNRVNLV
jgi:hypothetical protein